MAKDVIVVVQRSALPTTKESLDILLISTTGAQPVAVYRDVESVKAVFGEDGKTPNAKIVRKAATLMNQGKTTLAETLVNKFKIVGFEPPSGSAALPAKLTVDFTGVTIAEPITAGTDIWLKIGGDDKAVVKGTALAEATSPAELAELFDGTTFTKSGKTYAGTADGLSLIHI